jgi:hypothetical protein
MSRLYLPYLLGVCLLGVVPGSQAQDKRPVTVSGGVNAYAGFYTASGIAARNQPSPLGLSGAVTVNLPGGISLPFSAVIGNQGSSFRQPFNQIGISPTYKWITVHAGYRNITFSPFTLAGHTFLGGGVELNPGKLRLGAVYGRFNQAISTNLADPNIVPAYQRTGYSVKLGYGKPGNYFDVVMLRAADDSSSIGQPLSASTSNASVVKPAENLVLGVTSRLLIIKHITVELDVAASAYSRDVRAAEVANEESIVKSLKSFFTPRQSTQVTTAASGALGYRARNFGVKLQYKRIEPNFQTMGAYYFQSDIESYAIAPNVTLAKGTLRLAGSYGVQFDNLSNNKASKTGRNIGSLIVSYAPKPLLGFDLQLSNYGLSQQAGIRPLIDTLRLAQNNLSVTGNVRFGKQTESVSHLVNLSGTYQQLSDLNNRTASLTNNQNTNLSVGYFYQQLTGGLGLNALLTYTQADLPQNQSVRFYGPTLGVTKGFFDNKFSSSANVSYLLNEQAGVQGKVLNASLNLGYQIGTRQNVGFQAAYLNSDTGQADQRFNETRGTFNYGISF